MIQPSHEAAVVETPPARQALEPSRAVRMTLMEQSRRGASSLLVFAVLGGLLAWGHFSGWTFPKFSSLTGGAAAEADDWCAEHGVPESQCVECNADLMPKPKSYGWCKRHGVHECPLEHPDVAQLPTPPRISAADLARAQRALDFTDRPENNSKCKVA